jgi:hypothetical protein
MVPPVELVALAFRDAMSSAWDDEKIGNPTQ